MNNRLTLRSASIQPPLRGRLAAVASEELKKHYAEPLAYKLPRKPPSGKSEVSICPKQKKDKCNVDHYLITFIIFIIVFLLIHELFW